jgi:hypothetical protein
MSMLLAFEWHSKLVTQSLSEVMATIGPVTYVYEMCVAGS